MPKVAKSPIEKVNRYVNEYKDVFLVQDNKLFCMLCKETVKCDKKFTVDQHLRARKHRTAIPDSSRDPPG